MTEAELVKLFTNLAVWQRGDERAPNKPLLLLLALGWLQAGRDEMLPFSEIEPVLTDLLCEFGPARKSVHPEFPFWRLHSNRDTRRIWVIPGAEVFKVNSSGDVRKRQLHDNGAKGGFSLEVREMISSHPGLVTRLARILLEGHFPESLHEDILSSVGLVLDDTMARQRKRDPEFRGKVLAAYENRCAVCGYDIRIGGVPVGLEAAHIKWHTANGPDTEDNGLALCSIHHKLFDRGVFTVNSGRMILVSEKVLGSDGLTENLMKFHAVEARRPVRAAFTPREEFTRWHYREVFKGPEREAG